MSFSKDSIVLVVVAVVMAAVAASQFLINGEFGVAPGTVALVVAAGLAAVALVKMARSGRGR